MARHIIPSQNLKLGGGTPPRGPKKVNFYPFSTNLSTFALPKGISASFQASQACQSDILTSFSVESVDSVQ